VRPEGLVERGRDVETAKAVYFFPEDLYYHRETHYWVRPSGSAAVVGLDALAQAAMGDIVYITLRESGHTVRAGERIGSVEAAKMVSFLVSPVSGRILRRNEDVLRTPSLVNTDPYGRGWLVEVELTNWQEEATQLLHGADPVRRWAEEEVARYRARGWID
jgi:glycine cleavage system H protein